MIPNQLPTIKIHYTNYIENAIVYNLDDVKKVRKQKDFIKLEVISGSLSAAIPCYIYNVKRSRDIFKIWTGKIIETITYKSCSISVGSLDFDLPMRETYKTNATIKQVKRLAKKGDIKEIIRLLT